MDCKLVYLLFHPSAWGFIFPVDSSDLGGELSLLFAAASFAKKICASPLSTAVALPPAPPAVPLADPPRQRH